MRVTKSPKSYVAAQFERVGLEPHDGASYLQPFELLEATADLGSRLEIGQLDVREPEARFAPGVRHRCEWRYK